jgi:hypothetical protein
MVRGVAVGAVVLALSASAVAASTPRPNLVVSRASVLQSGGALHVRALVANRGSVSTRRTVMSFALGGTRIAIRRMLPLRPGSARHVRTTLAVPLSIPAGSYRLRVCVGRYCRLATPAVTLGDRRGPTFAGLVRATTCIPGPAGGLLRSSRYGLQWQPARDDGTPASKLVYDIYQATTPGGENFAKPTYTSEPGATSFSTPPLPDDAAYYFVARARDAAGNRDRNRVERVGTNLCV